MWNKPKRITVIGVILCLSLILYFKYITSNNYKINKILRIGHIQDLPAGSRVNHVDTKGVWAFIYGGSFSFQAPIRNIIEWIKYNKNLKLDRKENDKIIYSIDINNEPNVKGSLILDESASSIDVIIVNILDY